MVDRIGQQLGNYRVVRYLNHGGFAEVYLGEHIFLNNRQVAIKVLHTDKQLTEEDLEQFRKEANIIAGLEHPNIVRIWDFNIEDGLPFLVMDYAPNGTLRQQHPKGSIVPSANILSYVKQLSRALSYAHSQKLIQMPSRKLCKGIEQESRKRWLGELMGMTGGQTIRHRMKPAGL